MTRNELMAIEDIQNRIHAVRGVQVMRHSDLSTLYGAETRVLKQAVKRNRERFPELFCFQLTIEEYERLTSQIATLESKRGKHRKYLPYAFTEQGVAMLSKLGGK